MLRCCEHFINSEVALGRYDPKTGYGGISNNNIEFYMAYTS